VSENPHESCAAHVLRIQSAGYTLAMSLQLLKLDSTPDLVERVYHALVEAISAGLLQAGARITQEDLAERFAVSRQPVLQAFRLLKSDGLLLDAPGRGVLVAPLDATSIIHVYQVRSTLDALAARLAAQRRYQVDPRLLANGRKAARGRDVAAMIEADVSFHAAIYAGSGNTLIEQSARLHWCHVRRAMGAVLQASGLRGTVWDEHEAIAGAIAAGQADKAERLTHSHGHRASDNMARLLPTSAAPASRAGASTALPGGAVLARRAAKAAKAAKAPVRRKAKAASPAAVPAPRRAARHGAG
jgi:DNA-binding GntR family transcriptional regulator